MMRRLFGRSVLSFVLVCIGLAGGRHVGAEGDEWQPFRIQRDAARRWSITSQVPAAAVALVRGQTSGAHRYMVLKVPRMTQSLSLGSDWDHNVGDVAIVELSIAHPSITVRERPMCNLGQVYDFATILTAAQHASTNWADLSSLPEAKRAVDEAKVAARYRFDSAVAQYRFAQEDDFSWERLRQLQSRDPDAAWEAYKAHQRREEVNLMMEVLVQPLLSWFDQSTDAMHEKEAQWAAEAKQLRGFVQKMREVRQQAATGIEAMAAYEAFGRAFGIEAARLLEGMTQAEVRVRQVRNLCSTSAGVKNYIAIDAAAGTQAVAPFVLALSFDDGTKALAAAFPVEPRRDHWEAAVFWPPGAKSVAIKPQHRSGTSEWGKLNAPHRPATEWVRAIERIERDAQKRLKKAEWAAKGGAATDTVIVY